MAKRTPAQMIREARSLWADDVSFDAARSIQIGRYGDYLRWTYLTAEEQREVAENLLGRAVSRARSRQGDPHAKMP